MVLLDSLVETNRGNESLLEANTIKLQGKCSNIVTGGHNNRASRLGRMRTIDL
jgi:hypothetical protein